MGYLYNTDEPKTSDEIFAEALIQILQNQIKIEKHLGIVRDEYYDCYNDNQIIDDLRSIY